MYKFEDNRYINAGENEFYRWGRKARERIECFLEPKNGFYSIPVDGGRYYTFGTSNGKYGEFAKYKNTFFSVNKAGYLWAKVGTEKGDAFVEMLKDMIECMENKAVDHQFKCSIHSESENEEEYDEN